MARKEFETEKSTFANFVEMWDKAKNSEAFKNAPKPVSKAQTPADRSYYAEQAPKKKIIKDVDAKYWNAIYVASEHSGEAPCPLKAAALLDANKGKGFKSVDQVFGESKKREVPPNPVVLGTGGKDQAVLPASLGMTFDEEDFKKLEDLKLRLYELEVKISQALGDGKATKSFDTKVDDIKKQIDDLSDEMGREYENDLDRTNKLP